jgi:hypothetical protein
MSSKKPDAFTLFVPDEQEPDKEMPATLEVVDYNPARKHVKGMGGGAYNPYERTVATGDTVRVRKPRVDLRRLSEWIKTTQQVKAQREEDGEDPKTRKP